MRRTGLITGILVFLAFVIIPLTVSAQELPYDPAAASAMNIALNIISLVISILIAVYMYKDAEKRGKSGILWGIIGFCCGCIGLIVWLIVRPPIPQAPPPGYYPPPGQPPQYPPPQQPGYPPQQPPPY